MSPLHEPRPTRLVVITDTRQSFSEIVDRLEAVHGARVVTLDPDHDALHVLGHLADEIAAAAATPS